MKYDNGLYVLTNALKSVGKDKVVNVISEDEVGLAKDATLSKMLPKLLASKIFSFTNTGTSIAWNRVFDNSVTINGDGEYCLFIVLKNDSIAAPTPLYVKMLLTIGTNTTECKINNGNELTDSAAYVFYFMLAEGDIVNFEVPTAPGGAVSGVARLFKR